MYCFLAGQWLRKINNPPESDGGPYLYMFNHVSMFDQFMIGAYVGHYITAIAAIETFRYPIFGIILKKGIHIGIHPEGTRTLTGEIGRFKKGPFHLAKNTNATIVPIALRGGFRAKRKNDWRLQPGVLTVVFGEPISSTSYKELDIKELKDLVLKKIIELKKRSKYK